MSLLKNSKYTLLANIFNQGASIVIFLIVPNILTHEDYAQTIYISVLLSFLVVSDFGMSFVYSRKMPSVYSGCCKKRIEMYNQTFFWFRLTMSLFGSALISIMYFLKYYLFLNALLLFFLNPLTVIITFFISQYGVREDFKFYRNINIANAVSRIVTLPIIYFLGISGWIIAQITSSVIGLKAMKENFFLGFDYFNIKLIKKYFLEGVSLLALFFFWNQLLNSGRLFASIGFQDDLMAQYGLTNNAYLLLLNLSISVFLPVTISSLKIIEKDTKSAIEQLFNVVIKTSFMLSIVVILSIEVSPFLFKFFFPRYVIDYDILRYQLLSLMSLPLVATLGNIFQGLKQPVKLIFINILSFFLSYLIFISIKSIDASAAIAQCIGVNFLGILLLISTVYFYGDFINRKYFTAFKLLLIVFVPYLLYFSIRSFFEVFF